jgi:serine/threonine protein kinase/tetratricopeptide (TPR) repeat protein
VINGRYKIIDKIGKGRSQVFLCIDKENSDKEIAIKILSNFADADDLASFRNEFHILKKSDHPNIIKTIDYGTVLESITGEIPTGSRFFTLEYFPGKNLLSVDDYSEKALNEIIVQISSLLYYLHQSNFIYYDLKPENILVTWADQKPLIKIIDFGFAMHVPLLKGKLISGTTEYIAPEILRREAHDHRVDLYSFGMLLYRLIYKKFPFDSLNEIDIYKAQIENEFEFPETSYSEKTLNIIKKLLSKNPDDRYYNSIEILAEIDTSLIKKLSKTWSPAKVFAGRTDACSILKTYFNDKTSGEIFAVKGSEGAGKSSLLNQIASEYNEAVLISYNKARPGFEFIKELLGKLLYNEIIFNSITDDLKFSIKELINLPMGDITTQIKAVFSRISHDCSFFILFDNFNDIDELVYDVIINIIPILQVNKRKFVLAEDTDIRNLSENIFNLREINLTSFTEVNLIEFLIKSYYEKFPQEELKRLILLYADLLPGNIQGFIKDILFLDVIDYQPGFPRISEDEGTLRILQSSHDEIYGLRVSALSKNELYAAELISLFEIPIEQITVSLISGFSPEEIEKVVLSLMQKNILHPVHLTNLLNFTSGGLKNFIYKMIRDKIEFHGWAAGKIRNEIETFNRTELARQFELSYRFKESYDVIKEELAEAEKISAFSYMKKILRRYLSFPLGFEDKSDIKSALAAVLYNLSEFKNAEELINELLTENWPPEKADELLILKASCLIGSENYEEGKTLLSQLIGRIKDEEKIEKLLPVSANAEFELNNFTETKAICRKVIDGNKAGYAEKGKCYNLLGLISIITENNFAEALACFELAENVYEEGGLLYKVAQMEMNMGNIYNIKGEHDRAEEYWNKSLELTLTIGNLELEAKLLLNFGIYYFEKPNFETAMEYYNRALSIFISLGNSSGQGLVHYNIAETYLLTCEFEKAFDAVGSSKKIFANLKNLNEELESLFLYGKICFNIGDIRRLQIIIDEMAEKIKDNKVIEKHRINFSFLKQLNPPAGGDTDKSLKSLRSISDWYLGKEDKNNYFFSAVLVINRLISFGLYDEAFSRLQENSFISLCSENKLYNAEKNYITALIAINKNSDINPVDYLLKAYEYISESSITELTWRVLFKLTVLYYERGNYSKSREFNTYAVSVLDFIFSNIKNAKIKRMVMEQEDRKGAYNKLKFMQSNY